MLKFYLRNLLMLIIGSLFLVGCAPKVSLNDLDKGVTNKNTLVQVISEMEKDDNSKDEMWYWLNLGRMYQIQKDYNKSIDAFNKAEEILDEYENRAQISLRNIGSGISSTLFTKGAEKYYAKGYERTLMHTLNSINYIMLSNFEAATVEMRKMEKRQEFWLKESESNIEEAHNKKSEIDGNPDVQNIPDGYSMAQLLEDEDVRNMVNNYQDAFSYSLSSIVSKISGDDDYSEISKKRAIALSPISEELLNYTKKDSSDVDVQIIVLSGQAPAQTIEKLRIPFPQIGYILLDLPSLSAPKQDVANILVSTSTMQTDGLRLLKTDKMAYKTLKDEFPVEITKSIVRATAKGLLSKTAHEQGGLLAGLASSITMDVMANLMEKGYRNWEMLPNSGFISKVSAKRGEKISIRVGDVEEFVLIPEDTKNGSIIFVSYLSNQNVGVDGVQY